MSYYSDTKDCHNAQTLDAVCSQNSLQNERQCTKALAKNYIEYKYASDCVKYYANTYLFPEVNEVEEWCNPTRKDYLLGLESGFGQGIAVVASAVMIIVMLAV